MFTPRRVVDLALLLALIAPGLGLAQTSRTAAPLSEDKVARMVELKVKGEVIAGMIRKQGIAFPADDAALARLEKGGAADVVLNAIRQSAAPKPAGAAGAAPVTYQDVVELLNLGVPESEILARLKQSPTTFTLGREQSDELQRLGATPALLKVMGSVRASVDVSGEISNLAIVFDCSGSMSERTAEGRTKMEAARQAAINLVQEVPDGVRLAFIIYGHDRTQPCNAVRVSRPLGVLNQPGKDALIQAIGRLQPVGSTPIALALHAAGQELSRDRAPSGLVLISDGKETCGGDPTAEAAALARGLQLGFGVQVVGFGVQPDEKQALEEIAAAGRGKYFDAPTPAALRDVVQMLARRIEQEAKPAVSVIQRRGQARFVTVQRPAIQLPPVDKIYLAPAGSGLHWINQNKVAESTQYGQRMRVPSASKVERFELWWIPRNREANGKGVLMVTDLSLEGEVVLKPEEHLGLIRIVDKDLPVPRHVFLTPTGASDSFLSESAVQTATGYGMDMVVPAGSYDLWVTPADGGRAAKEVEKIEVRAGQVTVID